MFSTADPVRDVADPFALESEGVVELPLLLPGWQASVLETVARRHGLTAAAMVRQLIYDFLGDEPRCAVPAGEPAGLP